MCLFLNVSYCDMLLLAIIKKYYWKYQMSEKNLLFFYYNFDSTTLFSCGGETIIGSLNTPKSLMIGLMNICTHIHHGEFARDE